MADDMERANRSGLKFWAPLAVVAALLALVAGWIMSTFPW